PVLRGPRTGADDDTVRLDIALAGADLRHPSVRRLVSEHFDAGADIDAPFGAFLGKAAHRLTRARIAGELFVQHDIDAAGIDIGPDRTQEPVRILAGVEVGEIADLVLAFMDALIIG